MHVQLYKRKEEPMPKPNWYSFFSFQIIQIMLFILKMDFFFFFFFLIKEANFLYLMVKKLGLSQFTQSECIKGIIYIISGKML